MKQTKYIYDTNKLRCRLKRTGYKNQIEMQLQKRFLFFWVSVYKWMRVGEGFWGEEGYRRNPMVNHYNYGNICESWVTGTLNIKKRVLEFFKEYYQSILVEAKRQKSFESL